VNALIQAIPAIFNVLLVCLVFWLIFSILGVSLFGGRFSRCVDSNGQMVNSSVIANKSACLVRQYLNYTWFTPNVNFNDVIAAYLALFQVVTFVFVDILFPPHFNWYSDCIILYKCSELITRHARMCILAAPYGALTRVHCDVCDGLLQRSTGRRNKHRFHTFSLCIGHPRIDTRE